MPDQYSLISLSFGFVIVFGYSLQRFNEPSFPNQENLPHTLSPLRYMFLKSAYQKARLTYVSAAVLVYLLLVALGHDIAAGPKQAWPLAVALIMTGTTAMPPALKWLNKIEDLIRQWVHTWFLVPDGVERTIGILEDADYRPSPAQFRAVDSSLREQIKANLELPRTSLNYSWARASMLMISLKQMRSGADHVLKKDAFAPFETDFEEIDAKYKDLLPKVSAANPEEALVSQVEKLLRRIYAYLSWGVRYQVESEKAADDKLEELGFRIPTIGDRRLFDIVAPPLLLITVIMMVFYLAVNIGLDWAMGSRATLSQEVVNALISTTVASVMYGCAVYIVLTKRANQIEEKTWRHGSSGRLFPIAIRAGLITLAVIIVTTIAWRLSPILRSVPALVSAITTLSFPTVAVDDPAPWNLLPVKITAALPWFLAGATVSVILVYFLDGDVRRTGRDQQVRDAMILGSALGLAGATAQLIQISFADVLGSERLSPVGVAASVATEGFAAIVCGAIIGFLVPCAFRLNIMAPPDHKIATALEDLRREARDTLGTREAAENWLFISHNGLPGITPAEAVQYEGLATGVHRLLDSEETGESDERGLPPAQLRLPDGAERSEITLDPAPHVEKTSEVHAPLH